MTRVTVENANARLKKKWRRLKKLNVMSMDRVRLIVRACIILQNFVPIHNPAAENYLEPAERVLPVYYNTTSKREAISRFLMSPGEQN